MTALGAWSDTVTRQAIVAFAERAGQTVPPEERVAVFDNDDTLWCEQPLPVELGLILERLAEMAEGDESLRAKQPWKAAFGGSRDSMRAITRQLYGLAPQRVIGSSNGLRYADDEHGDTLTSLAEPDFFGDGPVKPVRIWSRIGRRPIVACGNSNGDVQMLRVAGGRERPALRLLVLHDDPARVRPYARRRAALERARSDSWTVVSVKEDWETVFAEA